MRTGFKVDLNGETENNDMTLRNSIIPGVSAE